MRLDFFQRLLDLLGGSAVVINDAVEVVLASALAQRQLALEPGDRLEVMQREGDRVLLRQPRTQRLHFAIGLHWQKFEFLLLESMQPVTDTSGRGHQVLLDFFRSPAVQASLPPAERRELHSILGRQPSSGTGPGDLIDPVELIRMALAPPLSTKPELYLQVPHPLRKLHGRSQELAAALRSLTEGLVASHRSRRILVRLHQGRDELLLTIQDIGTVELSGMRRLEAAQRWSGRRPDQTEACETIERCGGTLLIRGPVAHGRISISLPTVGDYSC